MMPHVNLYAEFLMNIRQVTIYAVIEDDHKTNSDVLVISDTKTITVRYEDAVATIAFPSGISGTAKLEFPLEKRKLLSLRLEITEDDKASHGIGMDVGNDSPWPARSLSAQTQIACRACQEIIVTARERNWKDLPREHWAELMDMWHCHKPHTEHTNGAALTQKGYSMENRPRLLPGLAFVDTCHLLIPTAEVSGIKALNGEVFCGSCQALLGVLDAGFEGYKLYKWSVSLRRDSTKGWEQNAVQNFVCAQMLSIIDSQAAKKFVAFSKGQNANTAGILVWAFNPDLKYSASYICNGQPRRAMKILFKSVEDPANLLELEPMLEELCLPSQVLTALRKDLDASNQILPSSAQALQGWQVALLDRFDPTNSSDND